MAKKDGGGKIFFNSIIYTISGLLLKCGHFFLLPLYTAYLTTEDYGVRALLDSFSGVASYVIAFALYSAASRFYVDYKDDPEKYKRFVGTLMTFITVSSICFITVFFLGKNLLCKWFFNGIDFYPIIAVFLIRLGLSCNIGIYSAVLRAKQQAVKCSVISFISFFASLGFSIIFVVVFKLGVLGTVLSALCIALLYTVYILYDLISHNEIKFGIDKGMLKEALKYSIPLLPHNLSAQITALVSNILIGNTGTLAAVGLYSMANSFGHMSETIQAYINQAYTPWLFEKLHDKDEGYKKTIRHSVNLLCVAVGLFLIGLSLFSQDVILLFLNQRYADAWRYVPLIVGVYAIKTIYYFYIGVLFYYKKASRFIFIATLSGSIINVIFSAWWIPLWGVYGSILADAVAMVLRCIIIVSISKSYEDTGLKVRDFIFTILRTIVFIAVGLAFSYTVVGNHFSWWNLLYKIGVVLVYILVAGLPYRKAIIEYATKFINKIKAKRA